MTLVVDAALVVSALVDGGTDGTWADDLFPYAPFAERVWQLRDNVTSYDA